MLMFFVPSLVDLLTWPIFCVLHDNDNLPYWGA